MTPTRDYNISTCNVKRDWQTQIQIQTILAFFTPRCRDVELGWGCVSTHRVSHCQSAVFSFFEPSRITTSFKKPNMDVFKKKGFTFTVFTEFYKTFTTFSGPLRLSPDFSLLGITVSFSRLGELSAWWHYHSASFFTLKPILRSKRPQVDKKTPKNAPAAPWNLKNLVFLFSKFTLWGKIRSNS